jgi:uroporphyrinogen decarboxylase
VDKYSHRERLETILAGDKPDRFAASFWRHFYHKEHYAEGTAEAMLSFQKRFDWDFIKINPRAEYHNEGWGLKLEWSRDEFTKHQKTAFPVAGVDDWDRIDPLKLSTPVLAEHLKVVSLVRKGVGKDVPILMTVFTPLAVAGRMMSEQKDLVEHLHQKPQKVEQALQAITQTFKEFVTELRNAGADGIFFATTQWASSDMLTWDEYQRFGVPYDLEVIKASGEDAISLLHVCSSNNFLKELAQIDYHCQLYNWDSDHPTNLPLDKAYDLLKGKTIVGGVDRRGWLLKSTSKEVGFQIEKIKQKHDSARLVIGPGCSIPPEVPMENLQAIRDRL